MKNKKLNKIQEFNKVSKKLDKMEKRYMLPYFLELGCILINLFPAIFGFIFNSSALMMISLAFASLNIAFMIDVIILFFNSDKNLFVKIYNKKYDKLFAKYKELGLELGVLYEKDGVVYNKEQLKEEFGVEVQSIKNTSKQEIDKLINKATERKQKMVENILINQEINGYSRTKAIKVHVERVNEAIEEENGSNLN